MNEAFRTPLDVPVQHGGVGIEAYLVRSPMDIEPLVATDFAFESRVVRPVVEHLGAAPGERTKSRVTKISKDRLHSFVSLLAALGDSLEVDDLYGREGF